MQDFTDANKSNIWVVNVLLIDFISHYENTMLKA